MHDINIKTTVSYGTEKPANVLRIMHRLGVKTVSFADTFKLEQNDVADFLPDDMTYINGTEWFTKLQGRGFGRVDLVFSDFHIDTTLKSWVNREMKLMAYKWENRMPANINRKLAWEHKYKFALKIKAGGLRRAYFDTLPSTEVAIKRFTAAGGKVFLSDLPFTESYATKCRIVKRLTEFGLSGIIVFKNRDKYVDPEAEIQSSLDLCKYAGVIPVVGSGLCSQYDDREVVYEGATSAFNYLTEQLMEELNDTSNKTQPLEGIHDEPIST